MKISLLTLTAAVALSGCAGVHVSHTDVASGATAPRAIYIRSSIADDVQFKGSHSRYNERPIRRSLAPAEYSKALKEEMEKMAPARVLREDEVATTGWLVESNLEWVHGGSPVLRGSPLGHFGVGRSSLRIHVRVTDLEGRHVELDKKELSTTAGSNGVIYEFDLAGGSGIQGPLGTVYAPGLGHATPFDYKNAAERVMVALSVDPFRYGTRSSPTVR